MGAKIFPTSRKFFRLAWVSANGVLYKNSIVRQPALLNGLAPRPAISLTIPDGLPPSVRPRASYVELVDPSAGGPRLRWSCGRPLPLHNRRESHRHAGLVERQLYANDRVSGRDQRRKRLSGLLGILPELQDRSSGNSRVVS
jgi:hypothetical protein